MRVCRCGSRLHAPSVMRCRSLWCRWSGGSRPRRALLQFVPPRVGWKLPASCDAAEWMPRVAYALPASRGIARRAGKTPHIGGGEPGDVLIYGDATRLIHDTGIVAQCRYGQYGGSVRDACAAMRRWVCAMGGVYGRRPRARLQCAHRRNVRLHS